MVSYSILYVCACVVCVCMWCVCVYICEHVCVYMCMSIVKGALKFLQKKLSCNQGQFFANENLDLRHKHFYGRYICC